MAGTQNNPLSSALVLPPGLELVRTFPSKRNQVLAVKKAGSDEVYVWKQCKSPSDEKDWLEYLTAHNVRVPEIRKPLVDCADTDHDLWVEHMPGEPLCEYLEALEKDGHSPSTAWPIVEKWVSWLKAFFRSAQRDGKQWILGDANLRNFLVEPHGDICGIDFESMRRGRPEENIGEMLVFLLAYNPAFTEWKCSLGQRFIERASEAVPMSSECIEMAAIRHADVLQSRRRQAFPQNWKAVLVELNAN